MYGVCHELQLLQKHRAGCSLSLKIPHYKKRKGEKSLLSLPLIDKQLVFILFCQCVCVFDCDGAKASRQPSSQLFSYWHTFCDWPVSKAITGRLLDAFMKYSNGSMSYCALIMPHKEKRGGTDGQTENNNERTPYLLLWAKKYFVFLSSLNYKLSSLIT